MAELDPSGRATQTPPGDLTTHRTRPHRPLVVLESRTLMLIRNLWTLSVRTRAFLRRRMPTNILLDKLRTRRGLKWGVPAMGLAVVYLFAAATCITLLERGWSPWLYLLFAICLWNALKFLLFGPISVILLIRALLAERRARRQDLRATQIRLTTSSAWSAARTSS